MFLEGCPDILGQPSKSGRVHKNYGSFFLEKRREIKKVEKENFITSGELREMRLSGHRMEPGQDLLIEDRLEEKGFLGIYEYTGGCAYLEPELLENAPLVAGIELEKSGKKGVRVKKIFYEHGHEDLVFTMFDQVKHFADFYGFNLAFLEQRKGRQKRC